MIGGNRLPFIFDISRLSSWQAVNWSQMKLKLYIQVVLTNLFDNSYITTKYSTFAELQISKMDNTFSTFHHFSPK